MDSYKEAVKKCINQAAKRPLLSKPMTEVEKFYFKSKLEKDTSYKGLWTVSFTLNEF